MVLPRVVCIVCLLVLVHKAGVVSIQAVGVPVLVVVIVPFMALAMCCIKVLVVVVVVHMRGLHGMGRVCCLGRCRNRRRLLLGLLRLLLYWCCGMHRHWRSMLRGRCWDGNRGWVVGWHRDRHRDGSARLLCVLRLCVCWGQVVINWVMLLNLSLDVLRVRLLVVGLFVDGHMGRVQLGTQTAAGQCHTRMRVRCKHGEGEGQHFTLQPGGTGCYEQHCKARALPCMEAACNTQMCKPAKRNCACGVSLETRLQSTLWHPACLTLRPRPAPAVVMSCRVML